MEKTEKAEVEKTELRSDEYNDIVSMVPRWYERWGIIIIVSFVIIILIGSWFFKYPDIIQADVNITIDNPPASVISKATGKLEKIFVQDNEKVHRNCVLAIIENAADFKEVFEMKVFINKLVNDSLNSSVKQYNFTKLGDLQTQYSLCLKQFYDYKNFIGLGYYNKKIVTTRVEIGQQKKYLIKLNNRLINTKEQLALSKRQFIRDSLLYKQGVIAPYDFEKSQNIYLQSKNTLETVSTEVLETEMQITRLQQTILDLESQKLEQTSQQQNLLKESFDVLRSKIQEWELLYVLKAPVEGKVTFTRFWMNFQDIKTGDVVFTVVPYKQSNFIAKIQLPVQSSGKIKMGNKIIIKLDDYPYAEYGFLHARINKISLVPLNDSYFAEVILPQKLTTSYGIDISAKKELHGKGEIIVKDQRLLYRFLLPLKAAINKNELK